MLLVVDPTQVPQLVELFDRQQDGEEFDVHSRWGAAMDEGGNCPPQVLIDFYLPELNFGVTIHVDADEYSNSIQVGIRSRRVILVDPDRWIRLQEQDEVGKALNEMRVFSMDPSDPSPAIGVLQQRFDYPRAVYEPEKYELTPETSPIAAEAFAKGARPVSAAAYQLRGDGPATIILVDPDLASVKERIPAEATLEGRWGSLIGEEHSVIAFDAVLGAEVIGRWLLGDPSEDLVRIGANSAHAVTVLSEKPSGDQRRVEELWKEGVHVWVPHVEALRTLHLGRLGNQASSD